MSKKREIPTQAPSFDRCEKLNQRTGFPVFLFGSLTNPAVGSLFALRLDKVTTPVRKDK